MMGMYIPICNKVENGLLAKFVASGIGSFIVVLLLISIVANFGIQLSKNAPFISLQFMRIIKIGDFLQCLEILWVIMSMGAGIMTVANLIWASSLGIAQITKADTYKPFILPVILISLPIHQFRQF
ncbi:hypothetical protein U472_14450 [Orenia metallireducens]|uniref:Uncharacterized protein n=2 Tax=Orenia metallireducens TaxID=1413210 RepID=A0A1C0A614_9FIRM|nr:hypothetical protein U472_14450 [Orenia metallireducens]